MSKAYFDYQNSTPVSPEVLEAMRPFWSEVFSSPSALHAQGLKARDAMDHARSMVAALVGAESPEEIIFTSGATESANLAVQGAAWAGKDRGNHIVLSAIEHPAVMKSVEFLQQRGFTCTVIPVNSQGMICPDQVEEAITAQTILLCLHHGNHDLGTVQSVRAITSLAEERGIPAFVDASTSGGSIEVDVNALGATMLSLAPHRFHGPKGVGVLYRRRRTRLAPLIHGGKQEFDLRAGTENVPAIVGAGKAAEIARRDLARWMRHTATLQRQLWDGLNGIIPLIRLNGPAPGPLRLPTNLNFSVEFVEGEGLVLMSDVRGIALATGSSCVSKSLKGSPVLEAIGLARSLAQANVMLTLAPTNAEMEVQYFLEVFPKLVEKLRGMSPTWDDFKAGVIPSIIGSRD